MKFCTLICFLLASASPLPGQQGQPSLTPIKRAAIICTEDVLDRMVVNENSVLPKFFIDFDGRRVRYHWNSLEIQRLVTKADGTSAGTVAAHVPYGDGYAIEIKVKHVNKEYVDHQSAVRQDGGEIEVVVNRPVQDGSNPVYSVYARYGTEYSERDALSAVVGLLDRLERVDATIR